METESEIIKNVNQVITWSQDITEHYVDSSKWIKIWKEKKKRFIDMFGGKLIYEVPEPIQFELSDIEKDRSINKFIEWLRERMDNWELADFVEEQRRGFFENKVVELSEFSEEPQIGMKLFKAFRYFENNEMALREIQDKASELIQQTKVEGTLCFSVHPLDFLSLSENASNWRSCHSLDGEYRAGNLSYMLDESTFICYLKSKDSCIPTNFPPTVRWNNKKWRVLLFADGHFNDPISYLMVGRQYPFSSINALSVIRKYFISFNATRRWSQFTNWDIGGTIQMFKEDINPTLQYRYVFWNNQLTMIKGIIESPNGLFFNDLLFSSFYKHPYYMFVKNSNNKKLYIGANVLCPICNSCNLEFSELMICDFCTEDKGHYECEMCAHMGDDVMFYDELQGYFCEDCYENETSWCVSCGRRVFNCDAIYNRKHNGMICTTCRSMEER